MMSGQRTAYGATASRFAECFDENEPVIVFDHTGAGEALRDAAQRKARQESFFVRALLPREEYLRIDAVVPSMLKSISDHDERRIALEMAGAGTLLVSNAPLRNAAMYDPGVLRIVNGLLRLADGLVVSNESERRRIYEITLASPPVIHRQLRDPLTPVRPSQSGNAVRDSVVVWAPHLAGDVAIGYALGLGLNQPIVVVAATAPSHEGIATWFPPERGIDALQRARLIVDTNAAGSDSAVQLATWNVPLLADVESGAQEVLDGAVTYDRRRGTTLHDAALAALGALPPRERAVFTSLAQPRRDELPENGPLVSVLIPTFSRAHMLKDSIESVMRQSYKNIETIVVNDAGDPIDELIASFPGVRLINMAENSPFHSLNTAFESATGTYVTILNDDDIYFPDHVASLVAALERSGCSVANADVMTAYLRGSGETWSAYGLESNMSRAVDAAALLISNQIGITSVMFRRSAIDEGTLLEASVPYYRDYALWLRLAGLYDFVHVERITSCYTIRNEGAQQVSVMWNDRALRAYQAIYARYPIAGRPILQRRRDEMLGTIAQGHTGLNTQPAVQVRPFSWPLWVS